MLFCAGSTAVECLRAVRVCECSFMYVIPVRHGCRGTGSMLRRDRIAYGFPKSRPKRLGFQAFGSGYREL
jgi:hypothetical protein